MTHTAPRTVLVTGGNRGIGRAIVDRFLADGHKVASFSRAGEAPDGVLGVACDVADPAAVDAGFAAVEAELGPVEVLVSNAGLTRDTLLLRMSEEDWSQVLDVNLAGSFRVAKRAARSMIRGRWGRIVFTGSVVTAAGLVFAFTMMSMSVSKLIIIGQVGTTIGLGLLFDTLIVRSLMTPSIAALLGRWFWWPQRVRPRPVPSAWPKPRPKPKPKDETDTEVSTAETVPN